MTAEPEKLVCKRLEESFDRLTDRVELYRQVRMLCYTHASRSQPVTLRIDYVVRFDGGPLLGVETKGTIETAADLGRALLQCAHYAAGIIGASTVNRISPALVGKPLAAVLLYTDTKNMSYYVRSHGTAAHRLYGPANVGFLFHVPRGLEARLCGERLWTEWSSWHQGMLNKNSRSGNGSFHP